MKPRPVIFDAECLAKCVREWQDRLGLNDWQIASRFARAEEMPPDSDATVGWVFSAKTALIRVKDPVDYGITDPDAAEFPQDMEFDVVHELLHLKLPNWKPGKGSFDSQFKEQAMSDLARAFVGLKRGGR